MSSELAENEFMWQDPIVEEVHRIRDEHAKKFNYDLHLICDDFRDRQRLSGRAVVSRPPRRPLFQAIKCASADGTSSPL